MNLQKPLTATDENGAEVFMIEGDEISEVSDAGPVYDSDAVEAVQWTVVVRFTPSHKQWTELVMVDAVELLKALAG